jgi:hypothetical protein
MKFRTEAMKKELTKVVVDKKNLHKVHTKVLQEKEEVEQKAERVQQDVQKIYSMIPKIRVVIKAKIEDQI